MVLIEQRDWEVSCDKIIIIGYTSNANICSFGHTTSQYVTINELLDDQIYFIRGIILVEDLLGVNLARDRPTSQSTTWSNLVASLANDGNYGTQGNPDCSVTSDGVGGANWWMVELFDVIKIAAVVVYGRTDCCG